MKVLVDVCVWKGTRTGVENYIEELLRQIAHDQSMRLFALCRNQQQVDFVKAVSDGRIECVTKSGMLNLRNRSIASSSNLAGFDVIHVPTPVFPFLGKPVGSRVICTVHDVTPVVEPRWHKWTHSLYFRWVLPWCFRGVDHFIADSDATSRDLVKCYQVDPARITVVPLASKWSIERPALPKRAFFVSVGTVEPRKNLVTTVAAFKRFKAANPHSQHKLVLVGRRGWGNTQIDKLVGDRDDVSWTGYLSDGELRALYREAQALLYPSLYEGFGLPVLEAMALGCPVITSRNSSIPEVGGQAVLYVEPTDVDEVAQAMSRIAFEPGLVERLVERGTERAGLFSWERVARETRAVYDG